MKGLLLKDFYMAKKYCRFFLVLIAVFIAMAFVEDNLFLAFYPCILTAMLPVTLLGYDERSKWDRYSAALPYTEAQLVSSKYLTGLMLQLPVLILISIAQAVRMHQSGVFQMQTYLNLMLMLGSVTFLAPAFSLPLIFKLGTEKGRLAYYFTIGLLCAFAMLAGDMLTKKLPALASIGFFPILITLICIGLYVFSWYLSIVFYRKREKG